MCELLEALGRQARQEKEEGPPMAPCYLCVGFDSDLETRKGKPGFFCLAF